MSILPDLEPKIQEELLKLAALIASGQYDAVEVLSAGRRMTALDMKEVVDSYPDELAPIPPEGHQAIVITPVKHKYLKKSLLGHRPRAYIVEAPLWTKSQGQSDLYLTLVVTEMESGQLDTEVGDLRMS